MGNGQPNLQTEMLHWVASLYAYVGLYLGCLVCGPLVRRTDYKEEVSFTQLSLYKFTGLFGNSYASYSTAEGCYSDTLGNGQKVSL